MSKEEFNSRGYQTEDDSEDTVLQGFQTKHSGEGKKKEDAIVLSGPKDCALSSVVVLEPGNTPTIDDVEYSEIKDDKSKRWKKVTIGGVTGIAMGIATAHALHGEDIPTEEPESFIQEKEEPAYIREPESVDEPQPETTPFTGFKEATCVHDNMTFGEAYHAARREVGPGGIFTFEGEIYSTYNEEEWDSMSRDEKTLYNERLNEHIRSNHHPDVLETETEETENLLTLSEPETGDMVLQLSEPETGDMVLQLSEENAESPDYSILSVATDGNGTNVFTGITPEGSVFKAVDNARTSYIEYLMVDENNNSEFEENEIRDISGFNKTVDDFDAGTFFDGMDETDDFQEI